ncbi:hypothetical protein B0H13DRAFT_2371399 [Mycena leptocephala]|nr:hypothetical protein B0H13DRAFT_2371399 [Mycena leptocephala]
MILPLSAASNASWRVDHRTERNLKKKGRMATLRARQAQESPDVANGRRKAACESARKYRERNREQLAEKARAVRLKAKVRVAAIQKETLEGMKRRRDREIKVAALKREHFEGMIRRREREIRRLPMAVPATWSLQRRQEALDAREALIARDSEVLSSDHEDEASAQDALGEDSDNESSVASALSAAPSIHPQASLEQGERFTNVDYILATSNTRETVPLTISYDIACQWRRNVQAAGGVASSVA